MSHKTVHTKPTHATFYRRPFWQANSQFLQSWQRGELRLLEFRKFEIRNQKSETQNILWEKLRHFQYSNIPSVDNELRWLQEVNGVCEIRKIRRILVKYCKYIRFIFYFFTIFQSLQPSPPAMAAWHPQNFGRIPSGTNGPWGSWYLFPFHRTVHFKFLTQALRTLPWPKLNIIYRICSWKLLIIGLQPWLPKILAKQTAYCLVLKCPY